MTYHENHPAWHYVDYPYHLDGKTTTAPVETWDGKSDPANLIQAMQKVTTEFKDPATKDDRRAIDICWIEHLIGDIHQPLHAVSLYSADYPDGDRGGNSIHIRTDSNPNMNLHAFWDDIEGVTGPRLPRQPGDDPQAGRPAGEGPSAVGV